MTESAARTQRILKAEGIRKVFKKGKDSVEVLRGIDFEMQAGERVAIMGSSGAGKSTLLHVLGSLEKPNQGRVLAGAPLQNIYQLGEKQLAQFRNRSLGFIFQFHYLLPEFSAVENVMMPALIAGYDSQLAQKQARELLEFVGLGHRFEHRPAELSGGEQQRVAIARSVILRPKILFADEPTGNLDSQNRNRILELLVQLNRATGVALLLVTHDRELTDSMDRVLEMKDGNFLG